MTGFADSQENLSRLDFAKRCVAHYKETLDEVVSTAEEAKIIVDFHGRICGWDQVAEKIFGYSANEIIGQHFTVLFPGDRLQEAETACRMLELGEPLRDFRTVRKAKSGALLEVSQTVVPILDPTSRLPVGCTTTVRNVSALQKSLEKACTRAIDQTMAREEILKRSILGVVTHELRTPLAQIIGMNELLISSGLTQEQAVLAEHVHGAAHNLLEVVNNFIVSAELETGQIAVYYDPIDLHQLLFKLKMDFERCCSQKKIEFELSVDNRIPEPIMTDSRCLHIVLRQLLANAIKFTERGLVKLSASARSWDGTMLIRFAIENSGEASIDSGDDISLLQQADMSNRRKFNGVGLGLSIARGLIEMLGGALQVEHDNGRTVVWFEIVVPNLGSTDHLTRRH